VSAPGPRPAGPYTPVVRAGDWLIVSGQVGATPGADGAPRVVEGGTAAELRQALANLQRLLETNGASLSDVVKATVFLVDMSEFATLNEIWIATFPEPRPARTTIGVAALPLGARIEVEAWAYPGAR
jgi:2-iminobutanoate/2-iminopropanoate deaminase